MDATLAGALIGGGSAVAGVVITLTAGAIQDRARRRHDTHRAEADRAERRALATLERKEQLYGTFMFSTRAASAFQWDALLNVQPVALTAQNSQAYRESTRLLSALKLIAPAPVITTATDWWMAVTEGLGWAVEVGPRTDRHHPAPEELYDKHTELVEASFAGERAFLVAARADLGITDSLPDSGLAPTVDGWAGPLTLGPNAR